MGTIDVIIPCYNYARYLQACVDSVLANDGVVKRVLILDDASLDDTGAVAARLVARYESVTYRRHAVNQGHIATYNEGLEWAASDYLLLISADDLVTPGALLRAVRLLDAHPDVGLVYGRQIVFREDPPPPYEGPVMGPSGSRIQSGAEFLRTACESADNPVPTPTAVVRTALQKQVGGYRKELPHTADLEMWLRLAARAAVGIVDAEQAYKRMHGQNMQIQYVARMAGDIEHRRSAFESFFRDAGAVIADGEKLQSTVRHALAEQAFWSASTAFDQKEMGAYRELLNYARDLDPTLPGRREWARLRWKRRLGPCLWRVLRPLVDRLRGRHADPMHKQGQVAG
jgi:hypothetical protein